MPRSLSSTIRTATLAEPMTQPLRQRREPVQERSRKTVARILNAASALINEDGIEAATTRAIADRAGVTYPSLYRFFADREEILERLVERHIADLDAHLQAVEHAEPPTSIDDLIGRGLELHVAYYEAHVDAQRLWYGGRASPTVVKEARHYQRTIAQRIRELLIDLGAVPAKADPLVFEMLFELGDRILDRAFRDSVTADRRVIELGRTALTAYLGTALQQQQQ